MKALIKKIHLWLSLPFGLVISVICLTGAILVFEQDITKALQRELYTVTPPEEGVQPLPPSALAAGIMAGMTDSILSTVPGARPASPQPLELTSIQISGDPRGTALASFRQTGKSQLAVNPYTGEILGWTKSYLFFQTVKKIHRWLMDPPPSKGQKSVGKTVVGISTIVMAVILLSGLVIWIPRNRKALKNRLRVSFNKGWHRFWYDSHVALGFYATAFLLVMALTGLTWSFGWYRNAAYSLFGANVNDKPTSAITLHPQPHTQPKLQNGNRQQPQPQQPTSTPSTSQSQTQSKPLADQRTQSQLHQPQSTPGTSQSQSQTQNGNRQQPQPHQSKQTSDTSQPQTQLQTPANQRLQSHSSQRQQLQPHQPTSTLGTLQPQTQLHQPQSGYDYSVWDKAVSELRNSYPVYKTMTLNENTIQIIPDPNAVMRKADIITFDPATGTVTDIRPYSERPRSQTIKGWFYAFHTGSWGGMATKVLYFLAALIGSSLPLTGYYLWWKRIRRRT